MDKVYLDSKGKRNASYILHLDELLEVASIN